MFPTCQKITGKFSELTLKLCILFLLPIFENPTLKILFEVDKQHILTTQVIIKRIFHLCVCFRLYDFFTHYFGIITLLPIVVLTLCYQYSLIFISTVDRIINWSWLAEKYFDIITQNTKMSISNLWINFIIWNIKRIL